LYVVLFKRRPVSAGGDFTQELQGVSFGGFFVFIFNLC